MKFFKQTKETKRKISFFMALAMIISLLPVSPAVKAAERTVNKITDSKVYVVNECKTHVDVSEILTGAAIKKDNEATTSAVIKVTPKNGFKFTAVSAGSINVGETGAVTLGGITVSSTDGKVTTGVAITVEKASGEVSGATTSCAVSPSAVENNKNAIAKVSIKKDTENNSDYAEITVDAVTGSGIKITLSYGNAEGKDPDDADTKAKYNVDFNTEGLTGAKVTAKCGDEVLDTTKVTAITGGSIIDLEITPDGEKVFRNDPVVKAGSTVIAVTKKGTAYTAQTAGIKGNTTITVTGTAEEDGTVKYSVTFDKADLKNADAEATLNSKAFTSGELSKEDKVSITVTPVDGFVFTENSIPSIEASGATTSGSLEKDGSYTATVTGFTAETTIKVSGEAVKSSFGVTDTSKDNVGSAKLDVDTATLEKNKDSLVAAFGVASKSAIEGVLSEGGSISVALAVTAGSITDSDKKAITDANLGVSDADLASKGIALDITLTANCYDKDGKLVDSAKVNSLSDVVTITMSVEGLVETEAKDVTRTYYIIKIHNGKAEKIECTYDKEKKMISFETKEFSTYILMYDDKKDNGSGNKPGGDKPATPGNTGIGSYIPSGATATPAPSATATPSVSPSATPDVTASAAPGTTPSDSPADPGTGDNGPSASNPPAATQTPGGKDDDKTTGTVKVKVGKNVTINSSKYKVTSVSGTRAVQFTSGKKNAKTVVIPATVKISGKNYKVTSIAKNAFKGNKKLKKVTIGVNVNKIGKAAFKGCKNLKSVVIKTKKLTAKKVGANAFKGINKKATFKVPKNKVKAYKKIVKAKGAAKTVKVKK